MGLLILLIEYGDQLDMRGIVSHVIELETSRVPNIYTRLFLHIDTILILIARLCSNK